MTEPKGRFEVGKDQGQNEHAMAASVDPCVIHPSDYEPHSMGDGRRFHTREITSCHECGKQYQVYGLGLEHICFSDRPEIATMIADALETRAGTVICCDTIYRSMDDYLNHLKYHHRGPKPQEGG